VVHALAAAWAEPGGSSVTRLLGLRKAKARVSLVGPFPVTEESSPASGPFRPTQ